MRECSDMIDFLFIFTPVNRARYNGLAVTTRLTLCCCTQTFVFRARNSLLLGVWNIVSVNGACAQQLLLGADSAVCLRMSKLNPTHTLLNKRAPRFGKSTSFISPTTSYQHFGDPGNFLSSTEPLNHLTSVQTWSGIHQTAPSASLSSLLRELRFVYAVNNMPST